MLTLVLWVGCCLVAVLGFALPYTRPHAPKIQAEPLQVQMLNVELSPDPLPDLEPPSAKALATVPPPEAIAQPQLPPLLAVALPTPSIAFAVPTEGPVRVVSAAEASYARPNVASTAVSSTAPAVQTLTYGQGAGRQPQPLYPPRAELEGQEGIVTVRFVVAENGRVTAAEAVTPSPWPLLNENAVETIRKRWRFSRGDLRAYEVAIRYQLEKQR